MRVNVAGDEDPVVKPPAGFRLIRVVTPSSGELEDIASYRRDLESARQFALAYLKSQRDWDDGSRPVDNAFWVAAITMYGRAFASGVRQAELALDVLRHLTMACHRVARIFEPPISLARVFVERSEDEQARCLCTAFEVCCRARCRRIPQTGSDRRERRMVVCGRPCPWSHRQMTFPTAR